MSEYLFVYGTLISEYAPPEIEETVKKLKYIGDGFVYGRLYDLGEYPGAILGNSAKTKIFGRIYQLPTDTDVLQKLDEYEEFYPHRLHKNLFVRKKTTVFLDEGKKIKAWIYEYNQEIDSTQVIESGNYSELAA